MSSGAKTEGTPPLLRTAVNAFAALVAMVVAACGSAHTPIESTRHAERGTPSHQRSDPGEDGLEVHGLLGSLSQEQIINTLSSRMEAFSSCFEQRRNEVEWLAGRIELVFRISLRGDVLWTYPRNSTVGDRQTERCLLNVAAHTQFPRPNDGEAEFSYPLEVDPPSGVRPPLRWSHETVAEAVERHAQELHSRCSLGGSIQVTTYIAPGGKVAAAGVSVTELEGTPQLDCAAEMIAEWSMPDPGSYPAKVTFEIQ